MFLPESQNFFFRFFMRNKYQIMFFFFILGDKKKIFFLEILTNFHIEIWRVRLLNFLHFSRHIIFFLWNSTAAFALEKKNIAERNPDQTSKYCITKPNQMSKYCRINPRLNLMSNYGQMKPLPKCQINVLLFNYLILNVFYIHDYKYQ